MQSGKGIVSGGALNVDYVALNEALKHNPSATRIKIFLPTTLKKYTQHYRKHAKLKTITTKQANNLIKQLKDLKKINSKLNQLSEVEEIEIPTFIRNREFDEEMKTIEALERKAEEIGNELEN